MQTIGLILILLVTDYSTLFFFTRNQQKLVCENIAVSTYQQTYTHYPQIPHVNHSFLQKNIHKKSAL